VFNGSFSFPEKLGLPVIAILVLFHQRLTVEAKNKKINIENELINLRFITCSFGFIKRTKTVMKVTTVIGIAIVIISFIVV